MDRIFVTGATGFVGSHLTKRLVKEGYKVILLVRDKRKIKKFKNIKIIKGDITNPKTFQKELGKADIVVHLAAIRANWADPKKFFEINAKAVKNLFVTNSNIKHIIITSSVYAMGELNLLPADESVPLKAKDMYGKSKISLEELTRKFSDKSNIPYTIIRPAIVYGPSDNELGMMVKFVDLVKNGKLPLFSGGKNLLHLIYIEDLVEGYVRAIKASPKKEIYIFAGPKPIKVRELKRIVEHQLNIESKEILIPLRPVLLASYFIETVYKTGFKIFPKVFVKEPFISPVKVKTLANNWHYDTTKAKKKLKFIPKINYEEGVKKMLNEQPV